MPDTTGPAREDWFDCPYDYRRFSSDGILQHLREEHPGNWPYIRTRLSGLLGQIDHAINDPAED